MADVYLTKIERKTIFTRSLIYVLVLFLVADLTVTGPFWFNFVPWLFLFSCYISLREVDKVLTGIIGTFTVFMASLLTNGGLNLETLLVTGDGLLQIVLGAIASKGIFQFVLEHRLVKYIKPRKKILLIGVIIGFVALSMSSLSFVHGDVFTYLESKNNLEKYIEKTYNAEYDVKNVIFNREYIGKYAYIAEIEGEEVQFLPSLSGTYKDINKDARLLVHNNKIAYDSKEKISNILKDKEILTDSMVKLSYSYNRVAIKPDELILSINVNETNEKNYSEIASVVKEILMLDYDITLIDITINNVSLHVQKESFADITPEYIKGGFFIEELDD